MRKKIASSKQSDAPVIKKVLVYSIPAILFLEVEADSEEDAREVTFRLCKGLKDLYNKTHGILKEDTAKDMIGASNAFVVLAGMDEKEKYGENCLASNLALVGENTRLSTIISTKVM